MKIKYSVLPCQSKTVNISIQVSSLIPHYKSVSERCKNIPKQMNTIKLWRNTSTNTTPLLCLQVKLEPVWPCCTATSDRHAEGETLNMPTQNGNKETLKSSTEVHKRKYNQPGRSLIFSKGSDFSETSSCIFYCYILLWLEIPALLKRNHLNPVGPASVIAEGFSTRTIGGVLYTLTLDWSHYLCFTCSPSSLFRVCNKESSLLSPTRGVVCTCTIW